MRTLKEAKIGENVRVVKLHGEGAIKRRIMDMGITKGVEILVRKVAPLGDPMELNVRGYELSVRKADAEMIELVCPRGGRTAPLLAGESRQRGETNGRWPFLYARGLVVYNLWTHRNGVTQWQSRSHWPAIRTAAKQRCSTI